MSFTAVNLRLCALHEIITYRAIMVVATTRTACTGIVRVVRVPYRRCSLRAAAARREARAATDAHTTDEQWSSVITLRPGSGARAPISLFATTDDGFPCQTSARLQYTVASHTFIGSVEAVSTPV